MNRRRLEGVFPSAMAFALGWTMIGAASAPAEIPQRSGPLRSALTTDPWCDDFARGWEESRRRGVPMVVFITSDRCVYCDAMKRDTWHDASVARRLSQEFVAIRLHRDRDAALLRRIHVPAFPTTLVASPRGKVMTHRVGYQPPSHLHQMLSEAQHKARLSR